MISILEKNGFDETESDFEDLEIGKKDSVGLISLKKSKKNIKEHRISGNRLDRALISEIRDILAMWADDPALSSVILTSSHKVAFSRGAAIEEILDADSESCRSFVRDAQNLILAVQSFPKPLIAAVNGLTLGGGLELIMACDERLAGDRENVVFGFPETSLGLIPAMGGTQNLRRLLGGEPAKDIISRAAVDITAEKALNLGLVRSIVPSSNLIKEAYDLAKNYNRGKAFPLPDEAEVSVSVRDEIDIFLKETDLGQYRGRKSAPLAAALTDFIFRRTNRENYREGLLVEREVFVYLQQSKDCREGIRAMMEEREPLFKGL